MNSFGWAIKQMQDGRGVMREAWKGRGEWLEIQTTDLNSKMQTAYIYIRTTTSAIGPWTPSQADMLAIDWIEAIWPATRVHEPVRCTHPLINRTSFIVAAGTPSVEYCAGCCQEVRAQAVKS